MGENLVIVESPAKAKTIEKFLGKHFIVKSSFGHIRDLSKKKLGIDIENNFEPDYVIPTDKKKTVTELKAASKKAEIIYLASDEDREGEAISWHLKEALNLDPKKIKRIAFHEITKDAILYAIDNPRDIDTNLVMAQQARRVLDRIVGFELSPILWKKIKPSLSAGRVQSVALRLIVEKEREILAFNSTPYYKVEGMFHPDGTKTNVKLKGHIDKDFKDLEQAQAFLESCKGKTFQITDIDKKELKRSPAAPFTTSSLQQEASRKLGFSVSQTMSIAQRLYENGLITYMRTDSTNLSKIALAAAKECIVDIYGSQYAKTRQYKSKAKGAQEAHEAIRPTYLDKKDVEGTAQEKRLYSLIWKRTLASQMSDATLEKTNIKICAENVSNAFINEGTQVLFDGFLKLYMESRDDEEQDDTEEILLPPLNIEQKMDVCEVKATQKYTQHPYRYTEASLVKKMEELGIGRPSTYAPTISTLHNRGYIIKEDKLGKEREITTLTLTNDSITSSTTKAIVGSEKKKLSPENIGVVVIDFLEEHFSDILDYSFTAKVEESFDKIADGKMLWNQTIASFYASFHPKVESTLEDKTHKSTEKILGTDPATGKKVSVRLGKFGPLVQLGESDDPEKKFASLKKGQLIENITLEEALTLLLLPRTLGEYEGEIITCAIGRFGPYIKHKGKFTSLGKTLDPYTVDLEAAIELLKVSAEEAAKKEIKIFEQEGISILNGRYGAYIKQGKKNFKIPKGTKAEDLSLEECLEIIEKTPKK